MQLVPDSHVHGALRMTSGLTSCGCTRWKGACRHPVALGQRVCDHARARVAAVARMAWRLEGMLCKQLPQAGAEWALCKLYWQSLAAAAGLAIPMQLQLSATAAAGLATPMLSLLTL